MRRMSLLPLGLCDIRPTEVKWWQLAREDKFITLFSKIMKIYQIIKMKDKINKSCLKDWKDVFDYGRKHVWQIFNQKCFFLIKFIIKMG